MRCMSVFVSEAEAAKSSTCRNRSPCVDMPQYNPGFAKLITKKYSLSGSLANASNHRHFLHCEDCLPSLKALGTSLFFDAHDAGLLANMIGELGRITAELIDLARRVDQGKPAPGAANAALEEAVVLVCR